MYKTNRLKLWAKPGLFILVTAIIISSITDLDSSPPDSSNFNITSEVYIKAPNTQTGDYFGSCIAISGDTMVIGAPYEDSDATGINGNQRNNSAEDSGAVYVFQRSITTWSQTAYLKASNTGKGDNFGRSVAISGDTIVVGADSEDSNTVGINGNQRDNSADSSGAGYVFVRSGTTWSQQAYIKPSNTGAKDLFGYSVAISDDTIVVGAYDEDSNATGINGNQRDNSAGASGAVYVFIRSGTTWSQQAYIKASNAQGGDNFGLCVAISGNTIVVGADEEDSGATGINGDQIDNSVGASGATYVFVRSGTTWSQQAYIKQSNPGELDWFGCSVAISGNTIVVGAEQEDSGATGINGNQKDNSASDSGAAYVFVRSANNWSQQAYIKQSNTGANDRFGYSVSISDDTLIVGAYVEDSNATGINGNQTDNSAADSGAAYVFVRSGNNWSPPAYIKQSNTQVGDLFAYHVAISGDTIIVSASCEDSNATGINGNQKDNSAADSGAVYVFMRKKE